ncbi:hypothetical protein E2C01_026844 [Portunus trituberculatus]|uniref:Uncharacterized protein n=1 Tax=Portunus trituberculatus TaxID=210409 RepID=A0A5B7EH69_PORTR|nr:hypothetical protein [Portunus trituberculatus]
MQDVFNLLDWQHDDDGLWDRQGCPKAEVPLAFYFCQMGNLRRYYAEFPWNDYCYHIRDSSLCAERVTEATKNLGGRTIRVLAVNHAPSVFSTADISGRLHQLSGLDIKVVMSIGEALNFTPEFYDPGPDRWGVMLPNDTFNGMRKGNLACLLVVMMSLLDDVKDI